MKVKAFITHKLCEQYADCQDRFCINEDNRTIAISDGMSQSIFPDYWADLLSVQYANEGHCNEEDRIRLCDSWLRRVEEYRDEQVRDGKNPWKLNNFLAAHKGAGATICGVRFENATDWKGDVLGDSCVVEVDTGNNSVKILSSEEKAFDYYPDYYDSFPEKKGRGTIKSFEGSISPDVILLMVSDPFSEYIDKNKENAKDLVDQLLKLERHEDFCGLVDDWRSKGMHNDDSTLCIIEFDGDINMNVIYQDNILNLMQNEKKEEIVSNMEQTTPLPTEECIIEKQANQIEEKELGTSDTLQSDKIRVFYDKVIKELDSLLSKKSKNKRWPPLNKESISKRDISDIRNRLAEEYEKLMTSE